MKLKNFKMEILFDFSFNKISQLQARFLIFYKYLAIYDFEEIFQGLLYPIIICS